MTAVLYIEFVEVRCPNCNKLLLKIKGMAVVETVCRRCGTMCVWPDVKSAAVENQPRPLDGKKKVE